MKIHNNISLKPYNTFGIDALAKSFASFNTTDELGELLAFTQKQNNNQHTLILGGGSNILFTKDYNGLVLKNKLQGIHEIKEDDQHVYVQVGAGENWHQFVLHCIKNGWAGVENLSLIPGNVGHRPCKILALMA